LFDILELVERIIKQTSGMTQEQFLTDVDAQDATAYRILAIGEAAKGLSDELKARHPAIPWPAIVGMRNVLAHEYFVRESGVIWETIKADLPELAAVCRHELAGIGRATC
jgi:uncharacterized protein with HEPN domain